MPASPDFGIGLWSCPLTLSAVVSDGSTPATVVLVQAFRLSAYGRQIASYGEFSAGLFGEHVWRVFRRFQGAGHGVSLAPTAGLYSR